MVISYAIASDLEIYKLLDSILLPLIAKLSNYYMAITVQVDNIIYLAQNAYCGIRMDDVVCLLLDSLLQIWWNLKLILIRIMVN